MAATSVGKNTMNTRLPMPILGHALQGGCSSLGTCMLPLCTDLSNSEEAYTELCTLKFREEVALNIQEDMRDDFIPVCRGIPEALLTKAHC